ncbi:MAG TPA: cytochrome P450 [Rhodothermales bacterium]|nr:cytochrome P450 [Rhodothermales bacterium]
MQTTTTYRYVDIPQRFPGEMILATQRDRLGTFAKWVATGGDIIHVKMGPRDLYLLAHPDLAKALLVTQNDAFIKGPALRRAGFLLGEGLLNSEGMRHRRRRKLVLPTFHYSRLRDYADTMVALTEDLAASWHDGQQVDIDRQMMQLTLEIAGQTLFGADVESEAEGISHAMSSAIHAFQKLMTNPLTPLIIRLPLPVTLRLRRSRADLNKIVYRIIRERRESGEDRHDLLSMLLTAQDEETGGRLSDDEVRDEVMTLFLAGHETTANALTWTWYLLAQHPVVEQKLHTELDAVLGSRRATFDDLKQLVYTRHVFSEAMRLYPPAWALGREAIRSVEMGGRTLPDGAIVLLCQYLLHRDPRFWPDPEQFLPERFAPEHSTERHRFAYLPFSTGVRGCIGEQFAWTEGILVLATLARRWRMHLTSNEPVGLAPSITLRPNRPIPMHLHLLKSPVAAG